MINDVVLLTFVNSLSMVTVCKLFQISKFTLNEYITFNETYTCIQSNDKLLCIEWKVQKDLSYYEIQNAKWQLK